MNLVRWLLVVAVAGSSSVCDGCAKSLLSSDDGTCESLAKTLVSPDAHVVMCDSRSSGNAGLTSGQWTEFRVIYGDPRSFNGLDDAPLQGSMSLPPYGGLGKSSDGGPPRRWACKSPDRENYDEIFLVETRPDPRNDATAKAICEAFAKL